MGAKNHLIQLDLRIDDLISCKSVLELVFDSNSKQSSNHAIPLTMVLKTSGQMQTVKNIAHRNCRVVSWNKAVLFEILQQISGENKHHMISIELYIGDNLKLTGRIELSDAHLNSPTSFVTIMAPLTHPKLYQDKNRPILKLRVLSTLSSSKRNSIDILQRHVPFSRLQEKLKSHPMHSTTAKLS